MICDWQENLPADEMPPQWMWPFPEELEIWFDEVEQKREAKYGGDSSDDSVPMMQNELVKGRER